MCNNVSKEDRARFDILGQYAVMRLQGKTYDEIANEAGKTAEEIEADLRSIKDVNPYLYKQLFGE